MATLIQNLQSTKFLIGYPMCIFFSDNFFPELTTLIQLLKRIERWLTIVQIQTFTIFLKSNNTI